MRREILKILLTVFILFCAFTSCGRKEKHIEALANEFLDSFFKVDYEKAAMLCSDELGDELRVSLKSIESMDASIREMIIKQASEVKREITVIDKQSKKDTVVVKYKLYLPSFPGGMEQQLLVAKPNDRWIVVELGQ